MAETAPTEEQAPASAKDEVPPATDSPPVLGRLIRMRPLRPIELPAHPYLTAQQVAGGTPDVRAFCEEALREGFNFIHNYMPKKFKVKNKDKGSSPSASPVQVLRHEIHEKDLPKEAQTSDGSGTSEAWFARESTHHNSVNQGTANWEEFDFGLRTDHSDHEMDYTPGVLEANQVMSWSAQLRDIPGASVEWHQMSLELREMRHRMPKPLRNRVFPVAVVTGKAHNHFLVVQIPVDLRRVDSRKLSYGKTPKLTTAKYCSVEHAELVDHGKHIKWQMATASDAGGNLPMFAQKMGVPGAIVKDVGLFIKWTQERRQTKQE